MAFSIGAKALCLLAVLALTSANPDITPKPYTPEPSPKPYVVPNPSPKPYVPAPSPSPPPPCDPFPYCSCDRSPEGPYNLTLLGSEQCPAGIKYNFILTTYQMPTTNKRCCNYDLRKIEFDIELGCRGSARMVEFDGKSISASFMWMPKDHGMTFKILYPLSDKHPLGTHEYLLGKRIPVSFVLPRGPCATLEKFCRGTSCAISFFSPDSKCCEVSNVKLPSYLP